MARSDDKGVHPPATAAVTAAAEQARVAAVLEQLRAGVRQRRAELTTLAGASEETRLRLVELKRSEHVREPLPVSPRRLIGRLLVFVRKAGYHLVFKWHARGVLEQQNAFNHAAGRLLEQLVEAEERTERRLATLERRLAALEGAAVPARLPVDLDEEG